MKPIKFLCLALFFLFGPLSKAQEEQTGELIVKINNIGSEAGKLVVGLYASEENWLESTVKGKHGEIHGSTSEVIFKDVPYGQYGVSLFHDENNNDKLDMRFGFLPKESTACSNQAPARFGPPKWKRAKFDFNSRSQTIKIKL
ncbi:MAG: DUF2141 domain-containing protein [Bacteroidota bacterium]